ncbi:SDR family oxidoreductase [Candidatus Pelagibacter sp.]|nr:SDR family oxidoreductase [Candidatus Pelagibacter sp.]
MKKYKILITGGAGYIGSILSTYLVEIGHEVTVVDKMKYSKNSLDHLLFFKNFNLVIADINKKKIIDKYTKNKDFIIPLAALVGAPLCDKKPKYAKQLNYESIKYLVSILQKNQKIIYLNTNSGYGIGEKSKFCDENSALRPVSLYGRLKVKAEQEVCKHNNYACLRLATVFGISYRMRTDLMVNNFVYLSMKNKSIKIYESNFRRNFIHVRDVVAAILFIINNFSLMKNEIYNLGNSKANITKYQLASKIKKFYKKLKIKKIYGINDPDKRDYFVSNKKIEKKGFKATISLEEGILELIKLFSLDKKKIYKNNY